MSPDAQGRATRADVRRTLLVLDTLPTILYETRTRRGHSIRAAATKIGVHYRNLHAIEHGTSAPGVETIEKILKYVAKGR